MREGIRMSLFETTGAPERLQFFDGQRLLAADLQGIDDFHRDMRRLHLQTLHEPGIAAGFAMLGDEGDRTVRVGPGYAIDDLGREIVLVREHHEPVPPVAGGPDGAPVTFDLTVAHRDDAFLEEAEEREGMCGTRGAVRLREEPLFCWMRLGPDGQPVDDLHKQQLLSGRRLTVARAQVRDCKLRARLSIAERLSARPTTQPYVASGSARPQWLVRQESGNVPLADACEAGDGDDDGGGNGDGGIDITLSGIVASQGNGPSEETAGVAIVVDTQAVCLTPVLLDVHAWIDTTCAGFRIAPCYWARIDGRRLVTVDLEGGETVAGYLDALVRIEDARPDGFRIRLTPLVAVYSELFPAQTVLCQILDWSVVWKGVE